MKNKKWKRKAKRLMGKSDLFMSECEFCKLEGTTCYCACNGQIRALERKIKNKV